MKARVFVRFRPGILDPQGVTIRRALAGLGFPEVRELRVGRIMEISLEEEDAERARARVDEMCRRLLANPVTEEYWIEIGDGRGGTAPGSG
jgi:phosphoribosylformylglycinamidine synthase